MDHPDRQFTEYILHGLERGFSVGYTPLQNTSCPNLPSASQHPNSSRRPCRKLAGVAKPPDPLTPNPSQPCTYPALVSFQRNQENFASSTTFPPPRAAASMTASQRPTSVTIDNAISAILAAGRGCYLSKVDIKSAFRICPVRPADWPLLGIHWQRKYYFECALPFGLRFSPASFNSVADAVKWIFVNKSPSLLSFTAWTIT